MHHITTSVTYCRGVNDVSLLLVILVSNNKRSIIPLASFWCNSIFSCNCQLRENFLYVAVGIVSLRYWMNRPNRLKTLRYFALKIQNNLHSSSIYYPSGAVKQKSNKKTLMFDSEMLLFGQNFDFRDN